MNTEEILDEVQAIVDNPDDDRDDVYLVYVNRAQSLLASRYRLPGLRNGNDQVTALTTTRIVDMPDDYGRDLFMAMVDGLEIGVERELRSLSARFGGLSDDQGSIIAVSVSSGKLVYQRVPDADTEIDLYYYKKPALLEDKTSSKPEGMVDDEDFDNALIQYACWQAFSKIEQGLEGAMPSTAKHKAFFLEAEEAVKLRCYRDGEEYADPPSINTLHG